jgi:hypothetical protein
MMMRDRPIVIADATARMLRGLLAARAATRYDQEHLQELGVELDRALVLAPGEMPRECGHPARTGPRAGSAERGAPGSGSGESR